MFAGLQQQGVTRAYSSLEPEVLVLIAALTPISEAVQHTGGTALIAGALSHGLVGLSPIIVLGVLLVTAKGSVKAMWQHRLAGDIRRR